MKAFKTILFFLAIVACGHAPKPTQGGKTKFRLPVISGQTTIGSIEYFKADCISESWPIYLGKNKFGDTLRLSIPNYQDTSFRKDYIFENEIWKSDSLRNDGFELFTDYSSSIPYDKLNNKMNKYYYPVYIVNQTPNIKFFIGKDDYVFAIQEALDSNEIWRPIEGRGFDFCGNGYWGVKVNSNEFLTFLMPKYEGKFKTKLRVRVKIGDIIYISAPFVGTINESQFYLDKNSYFYDQLVKNKAKAVPNLFYGRGPLETEDENFGH